MSRDRNTGRKRRQLARKFAKSSHDKPDHKKNRGAKPTELAKVFSNALDKWVSYRGYIAEANNARKRQQLDASIAILEEGVAHFPNKVPLLSFYAKSLSFAGEYNQASIFIAQALAIDPFDTISIELQGDIQFHSERHEALSKRKANQGPSKKRQ